MVLQVTAGEYLDSVDGIGMLLVLSVADALVDCLLASCLEVEELFVGGGEVDASCLDALDEEGPLIGLGLLGAVYEGTEEGLVDCRFVVVDNFRSLVLHLTK